MPEESLSYKVSVEVPLHAPNESRFWFQARGGVVESEGRRDRVVMMMQLLEASGVHMYHGLANMWSEDQGKSWFGPNEQPTLLPRQMTDDLTEVPIDATPMWHKSTGRLILTGATVLLSKKLQRHLPNGESSTFYSIYNVEENRWSEWSKLQMPDDPEFAYARAGCTQALELPDGDILLPIYFGGHDNDANHKVTIVRCRLEGERLTYIGHGNSLQLAIKRGLGEPSLMEWNGHYYLTMRGDDSAYVAASIDGMQFDRFQEWKFDDGTPLGSYNTQQHWVAHSSGVFLAYTRKNAGNDEVFRHRAPLFMARVDMETLRVVRATETVLLPKVGRSEFGNFGVFHLDQSETWVTAGRGETKPNEPNVYIARIRWSESNQRAQAP